jgi:geranylgeranyl reductase family protein
MQPRRFDVLVVGSGPAGSIAALVLARGGARVALVDKARFPRDKACGDLVGPRAVQVLDDLGLDVPDARTVGDMVVVGPTGRRVQLPCFEGLTYPGHALAVPRLAFDVRLRDAAVAAGAEPVVGRADEPRRDDLGLEGFTLDGGVEIRADVVIGADGATSRVAAAAELIDPANVLWGFAVRGYVNEPVEVPHILLWEPTRGHGFPGYGWVFPGVDGRANLGLGLGTRSARAGAARAAHELPAFVDHLRRHGLVSEPAPTATLGGWLKLGMVGTTPARGRVLLVGDAAGLVNPLQGEGISQALTSGRAAAQAVLDGPADAAVRYRDFLVATYRPYLSATTPVHAAMLGRPRLVSAVGRMLTAPGVGTALAPGWSVFWNDLLDGAPPGTARTVAAAAARIGRALGARGRTRRWFDGLW